MTKTYSLLEIMKHALHVCDDLSKGQERVSINKSVNMIVQLVWCDAAVLPVSLDRIVRIVF